MALPTDIQNIVREKIIAAEQLIKQLEPNINQARLAGIDVAEHTAALNKAKDQLAKLKAQYGR